MQRRTGGQFSRMDTQFPVPADPYRYPTEGYASQIRPALVDRPSPQSSDPRVTFSGFSLVRCEQTGGQAF
ncbi:hypothetical protein CA13_00720 [Planctomycetes bacterium CA13]|uniref:Uncharacterized protein n=1 Tax=Novipirellula herctigrandis TaxID=2527986 RepID=A0A5C5YV94_9BACT|nr:hypothetical protein CA13_00720 [Planctomycetes bacterium CA13]